MDAIDMENPITFAWDVANNCLVVQAPGGPVQKLTDNERKLVQALLNIVMDRVEA